MSPAQTCAQVSGTSAAEAALDELRHELDQLPTGARDEAGRLLADHLKTLIRLVRAYQIPDQGRGSV